MRIHFLSPLIAATIFMAAPISRAALTVHFTRSGVQDPGNAQAWGTNITGNPTAFELLFDFTVTTDAVTNAIPLLEGGGNGTGMAIVLDNDDLHFWAGNNIGHVFTVAHGLTAPTNGLQIVGTINYDTAGLLDTYELFINGVSLGTKSDTNMNNDWAGADGGTGVGTEGGTQRYDGTTLFASGSMVNFVDGASNDITFNLYDQNHVDFNLNELLIPEPSTFTLAGLGLLVLVARRRR